ncbi:Hypothetical predicted protein [Lecanosticta acicola]|uniref:Histone chaperone domain-containing protein n=1 Tax=Lecanosticta acicola TaxID=111012 RepID=A0AAI9E947_9PEZI|nr:Hypothetical predicted protein [Lecanosticta acicola]
MSSNENDVPSDEVQDNEYASRTGQKEHIPVQKDEENVEAGGYEDAEVADSDAQLDRDDKDAIDKDNIVQGRTRGAAKEKGGYREPGDDEGIPADEYK